MSELKEYSDEIILAEAMRRLTQTKLVQCKERDVVAAAMNTPPPQKMRYEVVCSGCGNKTTVPFKPNPSRAVYCANCYYAGVGQ